MFGCRGHLDERRAEEEADPHEGVHALGEGPGPEGCTRLHSSLLQPSTDLTGPNMWTMRELSAVSNMPRLIPNTVTTASSEGKNVVWAFTALFAQ